MTKKLIALSLTLLLLCPALCSCGLFMDEEGNFVGLNNILEAFDGKSPADILFGDAFDELLGNSETVEFDENEPYKLEFESTGSKNCTVTDIKINPNYTQAFIITIPEYSPEGDAVNSISWGNGVFVDPDALIPAFISEETYSAIFSAVNSNLTQFEATKFASFFVKKDADSANSAKEQLDIAENYPIANHFPVYVFDASASTEETVTIARLIAQYYAPLTELIENDLALMSSKLEETNSDLSLLDPIKSSPLLSEETRYGITAFVDLLELPQGISFVDNGSFENFYCTNNVVLTPKASHQLVAELAKSLIFVCMDTDNSNYDWNGLFMEQQGTQEYKILLRSDVDPTENGYSESELNRFWRYVDGKPTPWDYK